MFGSEKWEGEHRREPTKADTWFWRVCYLAIGLAFLQLFLVIVLGTLVAINFSELFGFVWGVQHIGGWF